MLDFKERVRENDALMERYKKQDAIVKAIKQSPQSYAERIDKADISKIYETAPEQQAKKPLALFDSEHETKWIKNLYISYASLVDVKCLLLLENREQRLDVMQMVCDLEDSTVTDKNILEAGRRALDSASAKLRHDIANEESLDKIMKGMVGFLRQKKRPNVVIAPSENLAFCKRENSSKGGETRVGDRQALKTEISFRLAGAFNRWADIRMDSVDLDLGYIYFMNAPTPEFRYAAIGEKMRIMEGNLIDVKNRLGTAKNLLEKIVPAYTPDSTAVSAPARVYN